MLLEADTSVELKYEQPNFFQSFLKNKEKKSLEKLKEALQIHIFLVKKNRNCSVIFYGCVFTSVHTCLQSSCSGFLVTCLVGGGQLGLVKAEAK